ncbi:MAG: signal peptidase [Gaiellaceae bacterium]|jgi:signal peptidase II|nr:signal peptidase [Gaiellaceae bacterium]
MRGGRSPIYELPESPRPAPQRAGLLEWVGLVAVSVVAVVADQLTKSLATRSLDRGEIVELLPFFDLRRIKNTGIAFGQFTEQQSIVMALTVAAIAWMFVFFARSGARSVFFPPAVGLLAGGACSNLVDRVRDGGVTDFLHIHGWPIFNLADSFIVLGVGLLMLGLVQYERTRS